MRLVHVTRTMVLLIVCAVAFGCKSSNNRGRVEGTKWLSVAQTIHGEQKPDGYYILEFAADKTFTYQCENFKLTGSYKLGQGDEVTMHYDGLKAGKRSQLETVRVKGEELEIVDTDGTIRKFRKVS
ncbi:MAG TPA: hypothetical protein VKD71_00335 [Gemmataceae bacterium]|nr:hypothetical protein [Gemmataceae bacterium]